MKRDYSSEIAQQAQNANKKFKKQQINQKSKLETTKNVLLTPYKRSWPILPVQQQQEFQDLFFANLSLLVPQKQPKVPWSILKNVPRENRKDIRQRYRKPIAIDLNIRKSLIFGVNECTKALEKRQLVAVLISFDCNPEMMVNHVVRIAERQKIAVLVVRSLKETLADVIGFPCVCLGFRKYEKLSGKLKETVEFVYRVKNMKIDVNRNENVDSENNYNTIRKLSVDELSSFMPEKSDENVDFLVKSVEISNNPGPGLSKIQHLDTISIANGFSIDSDKAIEIIDSPKKSITALFEIFDTTISEDCPVQVPNEKVGLSRENAHVQLIDEDFIKIPENIARIEAGPYLYRTCTSKRAFEPPGFDNSTPIVKVLKSQDDFISCSYNFEAYVPSKIKRMKGKKRKKSKKKRKIIPG